MGLDISAGGYGFRAGSYSGFGDFRDWLAQQIGYKNKEDYWTHFDKKRGEWSSKTGMNKNSRNLPLGVIMFHSDCDGQIGWHNAKKLLTELEDVKTKLKPLKKTPENLRENETWYRESLDHWIEACREAIECEEPIHFG